MRQHQHESMKAQVFEGGLALRRAIQESVLGGAEISKQELRATQESNRILGDIWKGISDLLSETKPDAARLVQLTQGWRVGDASNGSSGVRSDRNKATKQQEQALYFGRRINRRCLSICRFLLLPVFPLLGIRHRRPGRRRRNRLMTYGPARVLV
jgi:hypothetical protein